MRAWIPLLVVLALPAGAAAQGPAAQLDVLPVRKVVLYKNGMGYFEHRGEIAARQRVVEIALPSAQLDDVLKSLTVIDPAQGRIGSVTYDSAAPLDRRLAELPVRADSTQGLADLLNRLRGAEVEIRAAGAPIRGRLMGAEVRRQKVGEYTTRESVEATLFTAQGELRIVEMTSASALRVLKKELASEVAHYLELLDSSHERDLRRLRIDTLGEGARMLQISYTAEAPVWKTTYRLVLGEGRKPFLQGWAIVDNTTPTDWSGVAISLVTGAPVSFVHALSQPLYGRRPVVPVAQGAQAAPQIHQATLEQSTGGTSISGVVKDSSGGVTPGALVTVTSQQGERVAAITTDPFGRYRAAVEPGTYRVDVELSGFKRSRTEGVVATANRETALDVRLQVGSVSETVAVTAEAQPLQTSMSSVDFFRPGLIGSSRARAAGAGTGAGIGPGRSPDQAIESSQAERLGEQFEYSLKDPVTIRRNQSALLPIVQTEIDARKVTIYNERDGRARLAVWLNNSSGLTLDAGSFTVIDSNAFAGEGLVETVNPKENRILSYALDPALTVSATRDAGAERLERIEISRGVMKISRKIAERKTYIVRNNDERPRSVLLEHPVRGGWALVETQRPAESTASYHRFQVEAPPKTTMQLVVHEEKPELTTVALANADSDQIALWIRQRALDEATERGLRSIVDLKGKLAAIEERMERQEQELEDIGKEQQRLRENLTKLGASKDEAALRARYVKLLGEQEDRIAAIRTEHATLELQSAELKKQRDTQLEGLTFVRTP
jgi:hypothetical protein